MDEVSFLKLANHTVFRIIIGFFPHDGFVVGRIKGFTLRLYGCDIKFFEYPQDFIKGKIQSFDQVFIGVFTVVRGIDGKFQIIKPEFTAGVVV